MFLLIKIVLTGSYSATCQSLARSSLSSLGSAVSEDGFILRQTVGQSSNTLVFINNEMTLRQGFQQPFTGENMYRTTTSLEFKLRPNPARDQTLLEFNEEVSDYTITVYDLTGKPLLNIPRQSLQSKWLNLKSFAEGVYIIKITSGERTGSKKLILNH